MAKRTGYVGKKLSNERFVANAKPEVVQKERDKQADYQAKYDATVARIDRDEEVGEISNYINIIKRSVKTVFFWYNAYNSNCNQEKN